MREAGHICLWGKDTRLTSDALCEELGASSPVKISVLAIGPAGENLVRYSCPINDYHHAAARTGAGAVMGAKGLKAIAVRGTGTLKIARPREFQEALRDARERLMATTSKPSLAYGNVARDVIEEFQTRGCFPHKNFQTGVLPQWVKNINRDVAIKYYTKKEGTCHACPISSHLRCPSFLEKKRR